MSANQLGAYTTSYGFHNVVCVKQIIAIVDVVVVVVVVAVVVNAAVVVVLVVAVCG